MSAKVDGLLIVQIKQLNSLYKYTNAVAYFSEGYECFP